MKCSINNQNLLVTLSIFLLPALFFNLLAISDGEAYGQAKQVILKTNEPIEESGYKTWSLFLISNPAWALPESGHKIKVLFERFKAFGNSIGPEHLAVWFWSRQPEGDFVGALDVMRSSAFCTRYELPPGKSPYILITTDYPGSGTLTDYPESIRKLDNYFLLELGDASAQEITDLLVDLSDQLLAENLDALDPNSEDFWRAVQRGYEATRDNIVEFAKKFKFTINTSFFKVEIDPNDGS